MMDFIKDLPFAGSINDRTMQCEFHGEKYSLYQPLGISFLSECLRDRKDVIVHITSKLTTIKLPSLTSYYQQVHNEYAEIGRCLAVSNELNPLADLIQNTSQRLGPACVADCQNTPFIFVSLPSYAGKTEAAIALDNFSHSPFDPLNSQALPDIEKKFSMVINLVLDKYHDRSQPIYKIINPVSAVWLKALSDDMKLLGMADAGDEDSVWPKIIGSSIADSDLEFHTVGLFCSFLKNRYLKLDRHFTEEKTIEYQPMTLQAGREIVRKYRCHGPIVVTMDEFNTIKHPRESEPEYVQRNAGLFFSRNVIRELECVAVLLGTDSRAVNLTQRIAIEHDSSRDDDSTPWCYLVTVLPCASERTLFIEENALDQLQNPSLSTFKQWLLYKLRGQDGHYGLCYSPGILKHFFAIISRSISTGRNPAVKLFSLVNDLYKTLAREKNFKRPTLCGTVLMLLSKRRQSTTRKTLPVDSDFVHKHFAELQVYDRNNSRERFKDLSWNGVYTIHRILSADDEDEDDDERDVNVVGEAEDVDEAEDDNEDKDDDDNEGEDDDQDEDENGNEFPYLAINGGKIGFTGSFRPYKQDELTYMAMSSGLRVATLNTTTVTIVTREMHRLLKCTGLGNQNAETSDPRNSDFLENSCVCSAVLSTQDKGYTGVPFSYFLQNFIRRLCKTPKIAKGVDLSFKNAPDLRTLSKAIIPYVAAAGVDARCTDRFVRIPDVFPGVFEMCSNGKRIDGRLSSDFLFDLTRHFKNCKGCKERLPIKDLKERI